MTSQLEKKFNVASIANYSHPNFNAAYHESTDDVLTCDGICYSTRTLCISELQQAFASYTANGDIKNRLLVGVWLDMAQTVLRGSTCYGKASLTSGALKENSLSRSFAWSTPEGAVLAMSGSNHQTLSLPPAVYAPLLGIESSGSFHPSWVEEALGFMQGRAAKCSFKPSLAVTRATKPTSRLNQIAAMTGLGHARASNLASAGLSGLFYLGLHRPEHMAGPARLVASFFNGLPYADELSVSDQGGIWSNLQSLAGPLLAAERLLNGPKPELFEQSLFSYHCCTITARKCSKDYAVPSIQSLFLARFYDSTLPSFLECFKSLDPDSILPARAASWGTLLSNDVFDYVSDGISGRAANLCWAIGNVDSPVECARMFRGCLISVTETAYYAPGPLFALLYMELGYMYTSRYVYYSVPCDSTLPLDDSYIPFSPTDIPEPGKKPTWGFRAALRKAFSSHPNITNGTPSRLPSPSRDHFSESLPPWQGLAATPCIWDNASDSFDVVATRGLHDILGCLDRGIYTDSPELYHSHLGWLVRQYDALVLAGRDNLGVGRYYIANTVQ